MSHICRDCHSNIPKISNFYEPTSYLNNIKSSRQLQFVDNLYSDYIYLPPLNKILHKFKYKRDKLLCWSLGYLFYSTLSKIQSSPDMFIPVPLHKNRLKNRGFNQAELLLNYYYIKDGKIPVYSNIVSRRIDTAKQVSHSGASGRIENLSNAFILNIPAQYITNKHIVIVDDVLTTGSTSNELAKLLKLNGAKQVDVCTLLIVDYKR